MPPSPHSRPAAAALRDRAGLTTVEYVIVLCLVAAAAAATWQAFGDAVIGWLQRSEVQLDDNLSNHEKPDP